jgi:hypothetical protein
MANNKDNDDLASRRLKKSLMKRSRTMERFQTRRVPQQLIKRKIIHNQLWLQAILTSTSPLFTTQAMII